MNEALYRAARAALRWTQEELATAADLGVYTIATLEDGGGSLSSSIDKLEDTLRNLGFGIEHHHHKHVLVIPDPLTVPRPNMARKPKRNRVRPPTTSARASAKPALTRISVDKQARSR